MNVNEVRQREGDDIKHLSGRDPWDPSVDLTPMQASTWIGGILREAEIRIRTPGSADPHGLTVL